MRSILKAVAATAVVIPVVLGGAQVAAADDGRGHDQSNGYDQSNGWDNGYDQGNGNGYGQGNGQGSDNGPSYKKSTDSATVWGGRESETVSGFREDGTAFFHKSHKMADNSGAKGHHTSARS